MINLEYVVLRFNEYIKEYDLNEERIKLKIAHMIRVMNVNIRFAKDQKLSEEDIELAGVIGLLHDIGRFVQVKKYNTFIDRDSINHAISGAQLLFDEGLINEFVSDNKYHYTIKKAIENHGKYEIEDGLNENTLMHCKLIRDADKADIYEVMLREDPEIVFDGKYINDANIATKVLEGFYSNKLIKLDDLETVFDDYVRKVAFIFGFYFKLSLIYIKEMNYINRMTERFIKSFSVENILAIENINKIREYANSFLDSNT